MPLTQSRALLAASLLWTVTASAASVTYLGTDQESGGNWNGRFGQDGNVVAQFSIRVPPYATFDTAGDITPRMLDLWSSDPRAPSKIPYTYSPAERVASYFLTNTSMDFRVGAYDNDPHRIALYLVDFERTGRAATIEVYDGATNARLDTQTLPAFAGNPTYVAYKYTGAITIRINRPPGYAPPTVSAIFWGGPLTPLSAPPAPPNDPTPPTVSIATPAPGPVFGTVNVTAAAADNIGVASVQYQLDGSDLGPPLTTPPYSYSWNTSTAATGAHSLIAFARDAAGNRGFSPFVTVTVSGAPLPPPPPPAGGGNAARFLARDTLTTGNWKGVFGQDGNVIAQHSVQIPGYASFNTAGAVSLRLVDLWATDPRAPLKQFYSYTPDERVESYFYTPTSMDFLIGASDGASHRIALYFADFERLSRLSRLRVLDPATGAVLDSQSLQAYDAPVYLVYSYTGNVVFRVENTLPGGAPAVVSAFFWGGSLAAPVDTTPPTVSIVAPAAGAQVADRVFVTMNATDNVGVVGVQALIDGAPLLLEMTAPPYSAQWDTTSYSDGSHTLTAVARDAAGNRRTSAPVSVTINNAPPPRPVVTILSPAPGATVSGVYTISVSATSPLGAPTISYQVDSGFLNVPNTSSTAQWDSATVANGPHTLAVFGTDRLGHTTIANVAFSVNNTVHAPLSVSFASPANGAPVSGVVTFTAAAAGNSGPVGFRLDNTTFPSGSVVTLGAASVTVDTTHLYNGPHNLTAIAQDAAGNAVAATITVVVGNTAAASAVSFLRMDTTTKGDWKGVYGQDGNFIAEHSYNAPSYSLFNPVNTDRLLVDIWTNDPRAPLKQTYAYTPGERVMSHWHTNTWMDFQVSAADARPHRIALYFADWQPLGPPAAFPSKRAIRITALDTVTGAVVARNAMSDYKGGVYLVYTYTGNVTFRLENLSNPLHPGAPDADASLTAVFWGGM